MAIVFASVKKKERVLFWSISMLVILLLVVIFFAAFPPFKMPINPADVFIPEINVDVAVLQSSKVQNLEAFSPTVPGTQSPGRAEPFSSY